MALAQDYQKSLAKIYRSRAITSKKPLLQHQVELCVRYGFTRILILVHHLPEVIKSYLKDGKWLDDIRYSYKISPRGTAGAVADNISNR